MDRIPRFKTQINKDYFETIDTPNKAYIFGFIMADGCVYSPKRGPMVLAIGIQERDIEVLQNIKKDMNFNGNIRRYTEKMKKGMKQDPQPIVQMTIAFNKICHDLMKLGCVPRKSLILQFPTEEQVPKHLVSHFLRGYWDGDGCVTSSMTGRHKNPQFSGSFVGTFDFCNKVNHIFDEEVSIPLKSVSPCNKRTTTCRYMFHGNEQVKKAYKYLYKDAELFLTRKKLKMEEVFQYKAYKGKNEPGFVENVLEFVTEPNLSDSPIQSTEILNILNA